MPYLPDDKDKDNQGQPIDPGSTQGGAFAGGTTGPGSTPSGSGGGVKPFVNIQEYLKANPNGGGTESYLQNQVGPAIDNEINNFNTSLSNYKNTAGNQDVYNSEKQAQQNIGDLRQEYSQYGNSNDYNNKYQQIQSAIGQTYQTPDKFNYQEAPDSQKGSAANYNSILKAPDMNQFYQGIAPGMSYGSNVLQSQLDVNSPNINQLKGDLLNKYAGYQDTKNAGYSEANNLYNNALNTPNEIENTKSALGKYNSDVSSYNDAYKNKTISSLFPNNPEGFTTNDQSRTLQDVYNHSYNLPSWNYLSGYYQNGYDTLNNLLHGQYGLGGNTHTSVTRYKS